VNALAAVIACSVAALTLLALLRGGLRGRLVADPTGERWHTRTTPVFGGVGIFAGLVAGIGVAVAVGATEATSELGGIVAGCAILFAAGLADDLFTLPPLAKLGAQITAAAVVLASGLTVEIIGNDILATAVGLLWLVGITNAFNLLDNMDGLAASLALVSCAVFAVEALAEDSGELSLVVALALGGACLGFLPFNLRPGRPAAVFMGDSGSQVLGFSLACLGLASSWTTAGATLTSLLLPVLVLAIPILDTTLVTVRRTLERRPVTQGGTDHSSHRLVYYGLTEHQAVAALTLLAGLLGATAVAYTVLDDAKVTAVGVLLSFVLLVQFASFLSDMEQRSHDGEPARARPLWRAFFSDPRRLVEVLVDFAIVCTSFLAAYFLQVDGGGTNVQRAIFLSALPVLLAVRYVIFVVFGIYRRVWRFASARDLLAIVGAVALSVPITIGIVAALRPLDTFPLEIFLVDAVLCSLLVAGSRLALRLLPEPGARGERAPRRRVLIVGAGRSGRALARELAETPDRRVVGFLDDNPMVRRRRVVGVKVLGSLAEAETHLRSSQPHEVLVTIPAIEPERLEALASACEAEAVTCRIVRREIEPPPSLLRTSAE
jgi:UDP-GlcNAc:undecaprenyl-phosphate/decaprenyl-phosphate GlcNAc-1-phosphate transferase